MNSHNKAAADQFATVQAITTDATNMQNDSLMQYLVAAILARIATSGSAVAIVMLARSYGADGAIAGGFAACLTAPHVLGPIIGRWLDKTNNPMILIAAACALFATVFQLVILSLSLEMLWLTTACLLICGTCSSFMMGGFSTQLNHLVNNHISARRRAQSWDNTSYGIGLTVGPMLIGLLSGIYATSTSVSMVMCLPLLSGLQILYLSRKTFDKHQNKNVSLSIKQVINVIRQSAALKRTMLMTSSAAFAVAALPVLAIYLSEGWQQDRESGAWLVTLYGVGCLFGSGLLLVKPLTANALTLLKYVGYCLLVSLVLIAGSFSFTSGLITYCLAGLINAIFFSATLAARTEYAPPQGAAQIYMWVAAAKISAASLGALIAGILVDYSTMLPLLIAALVLLLSLITSFFRNGGNNKETDIP